MRGAPALETDLALAYRHRSPREAEDASMLLLLHGLGSDELDLLGLEPLPTERCHVVSARAPRVHPGGGYAWFDVAFSPDLAYDARQAEESRHLLARFVGEVGERHGVPPGRIHPVGFSQGAIMALDLALTNPGAVGGVVAMSGRVLLDGSSDLSRLPDHGGLPILVTHGLYDDVLPIGHARVTRSVLERLNVSLTYREYAVGHGVGPETLTDVAAWLRHRLAGTGGR